MVSGGAAPEGYLGKVTLLIDGKYIEYVKAQPALPVQEPVVFFRCKGCFHAYEGVAPSSCDCTGKAEFTRVEYFTNSPAAQPAVPAQEPHNFCPRCGKRTNDIHTCTPPQEAAWGSAAIAPEGDIRALKHRIHELEGELIGYKKIVADQEELLERRADEREACAKVCEEVGEHPSLTPRHCADAIRERGNT
jgi:hypothetical protein